MSGSSQQLKVVFSADASQVMAAVDRMNQTVSQSMAGIQRAAAATASAQAGLAQATQVASNALGIAAKAAAALGVAFAGMKISEAVRDATMSAARFETMGVVLGRLAQNTQYSGVQVEQFAAGVQGMGITMTGSREVIARMIQSQIDLSSATKLARVAQDAAVIGNMNSSEALEHLVYGIQSAQVEMLRTLGLNVSFEQSYQRLATSLNKPVEALTEMEKTQARVSAALQAGTSIAGSYEAAMGTAGKQLSSMSRLADDFQTKLGAAFLPAFTEGVRGASQALTTMNTVLDSKSGLAALDAIGEALRRVAIESQAMVLPLAVGLGVTVVGAALGAARAMGVATVAMAGMRAAFAGWAAPIALATAGLTYLVAGQSRAVTGAQQTAELLTRESVLRGDTTRAIERQTQAQLELNAARERAATRGLERDLSDQQLRNQDALAGLRGFVGSNEFGRRVRQANLSAATEGSITGPASGDRAIAMHQYIRAFQDFANSAAPVNEAVKQLADRLQALDEAQKSAGQSTMFGRTELRAWVQTLQEGVPAAELLTQRIEGLKAAMKAPGAPAFDLAGSQAQITRMLESLDLKQVGDSIVPEKFQKAVQLSTAAADQVERLRNAYAQTQAQMADMQPNTAQWNVKLTEAQGIAQQITLLLSNWPALMQATRDATDGILEKGDYKVKPEPTGGGTNMLREAQIRADWAMRIAEAEAAGGYALRQATAEMEKLLAASKGATGEAEAAARAREAEAAAIGKSVAQARILAREAQQGIALALAQLKGPQEALALARQQEQARLMRDLGPNQPGALAEGMGAFDWKQIEAAVSNMSQLGVMAQKSLVAAQAELGVIGQGNEARDRAVALAELRLTYETALKTATEEQVGALTEAYNGAAAYIEELAKAQKQLEAAHQLQQAFKQVGDAIGQAFESAIIKGESLNKVMQSLLNSIIQIMAKQMIFNPLSSLFSAGLGSLFGGGGGGDGGLWSAKGNVIANAPALSAYSNSFVSKPTVFPFAKGGIGVMGEAGTEAIFPVIRTKSGNLGVRAVNDNSGGGGSGNVEVNVYAPPGSEVRQEQRQTADGRAIDIFLDGATAGNMRPGTKTHRALRDAYGARQQIIRR